MVYTLARACVRSLARPLAHFEYHQPTFTILSYWKCFQLVLSKYIYHVCMCVRLCVCVTIKRLLDDTNQSFSHVDVLISVYYIYIQIQYLRRRFCSFSFHSHPMESMLTMTMKNIHCDSRCVFFCLECKKNEHHMQNGSK